MPFQKGNQWGKLNKGGIGNWLGKKHSEESKIKISKNHSHYWLNKKKEPSSEETKLKISLANRDEKHPSWKGDEVGYSSLHYWIRRKLGRPNKCEHCGKIGKKIGRRWSIEWANINHEYKRNIIGWIALCQFCHRKYDNIKN